MNRIVVFHPSNELYGADRILVNALQSFPEEAEKLVILPKDGKLTQLLESQVRNVIVVIQPDLPIIYRAIFTPLGIARFIRKYYKFSRWLKQMHQERPFDLAYVNTLSCSFILKVLYRLGIRRFIHVHEILENPKIVARGTAFLVDRYSQYTICVSKAVEQNLIRWRSSLKRQTFCIHNGISPIDQAPAVCAKGRVQFYLFGRIMPKKGQWYLIKALSLLPNEVLEKAHFKIVGGSPPGKDYLEEDLRSSIIAAGLENVISLEGFCDDISQKMGQADVCIVPSLMRDPFPTTVLEAMSASKPVIATDHGGAAEVVVNDKNGFLIPPDAPQKFAQIIREMILNPDIIQPMGDAAKFTYEKAFTLKNFQTNWSAVHRQQEFLK